jgi:hypothetical protein
MQPPSVSRPVPERRFFYHAIATGLRGQLRRPRKEQLDAGLTIALSAAGGEARGHQKQVKVDGVLSAAHVQTSVRGELNEREQFWETEVVSIVEGLNILDRVMVKRLEARVFSAVPVANGARTFSIAGSAVEGLMIDGKAAKVSLDLGSFDKLSWENLRTAAGNGKGRARFAEKDPEAPARTARDPASPLLCSVAEVTLPEGAATMTAGAAVVIPDFGRIWLGELLATPDTWRLSMLRAKLGSPAEGDYDAGESTANGSRYPP